jgi:hypothetical protein
MNPQQPNDSDLEEKVRNLIYDGDYVCTRVWEAWQVGTMTEDDFVPLNETERVDEIVQLIQDEILKAPLQVAGKEILFSHTAVNGDMHLFIDGDHDPEVCPECIRPGLLVEELNQPNTNKEI